MARFEREPSEYIEKVVATNRVSKTVKGGRVMLISTIELVSMDVERSKTVFSANAKALS